MDKRRTTRGRPKRVEEVGMQAGAAPAVSLSQSTLTKRNSVASNTTGKLPAPSPARRSSPGRRASPARSRTSPVRRSSRPRSTVMGSSASMGTVTIIPITTPSPIKEVKEPVKEQPPLSTTKSRNNLPTTLTTNTSSRAPSKANLTESVHSSYSSTTQKVEIRSSTATIDSEVAKLTDYIRRSVSKTYSNISRGGTHTPATTTEASRNSRSVSQSVYNDDGYDFKAAEFSDNEEDTDEPEDQFRSFNVTSASSTSVVCRKIEIPREYGGWIGATLLMLLVPIVVYYLQWCCTTSASCKFITPELSGTLSTHYIAYIFEPDALAAYLGFTMGVFVLSASMFGRRVRLPNDRLSQQYNFNAMPIAVLLALLVGAAVGYYKFPLADFVLKHYLRFCMYGLVNAIVVAVWAYCRANFIKDGDVQLNIYGRSGNILIDFALGRQINPKWFGVVEFKQVFYRISLLTTLLFATCFIYKSMHIPKFQAALSVDSAVEQTLLESSVKLARFYYRNVQYEPAALLSSSLLLCYVVDAILFEHHLASSFELQGEGFGALLLLRYASSPYLFSAVSKYFIERRVGSISCRYGVYVAIAIFFIGLFVKRISSAIKYKYRIDPNNPLFGGIETIHTFQGRRLLLGTFWGHLRQPNYAGDILALCGLAVPLFLRFAWPPALCVLLCIMLLLHRSVRVNARNSSRYHSSWVRYCTKVRNYIVPKVF